MDELVGIVEIEIKAQIDDLNSLTPGSEEKTRAVKAVKDLADILSDGNKTELDYRLKSRQLNLETDKEDNAWAINTSNLKEAKKDRLTKIGIEVGVSLITCLFYNAWQLRGYKFEESGCVSSTTFKDVLKMKFIRK